MSSTALSYCEACASHYGPYSNECPTCPSRETAVSYLARIIRERDAALHLLRWYVENDDTYEGGKWEESNAPWLAKKRAAADLLAKCSPPGTAKTP